VVRQPSCVGRFVLTVMDGLGKMDRTSAKEQMHFHDKTRVGMFVFRWRTGGGGEGGKKVLFLLRDSYNPSKTKRKYFSIQRSPAFWKVPEFRPFVLLLKPTWRWRVWSIGAWRETSPNATLCTSKLTWIGLRSNPGLRAWHPDLKTKTTCVTFKDPVRTAQ
jgi:hypothetical protein